MKKIILSVFSITLLFSSCDLLEESIGITDDEIVEGLKTALTVGADSSSTALSLTDGYYGSALLKIPLPDEAEEVRAFVTNNRIADAFDLDEEFENVVLSINRAAESAAKEASPIFKEAITDLSISQGLEILNGTVPSDDENLALKADDFDSTAATAYLKIQTFSPLTELYAPKINTALDVDLGLGFSAVEAWETLTTNYNNTLNTTVGKAAIVTANLFSISIPGEMNTDLGEYSTEKALNGLFYMVGEEEKSIRRDPFEWALDILHTVFG